MIRERAAKRAVQLRGELYETIDGGKDARLISEKKFLAQEVKKAEDSKKEE